MEVKEQFYTESTADKLKAAFGDRTKLLQTILKMYKFMFTDEKKQIWEKTSDDISDDIMNAKFNLTLDNIVKESYANILNIQETTRLMNKKINMLPALLDLCYIYYVHHFNMDAPFHKLPMNKSKFRLIIAMLKANTYRYADINATFEDIINNRILLDMRVESPPFYLRTEWTTDEMREKMSIVVRPLCKDLINQLLKLNSTTNTVVKIDETLTTMNVIDIIDINNVDNSNNEV